MEKSILMCVKNSNELKKIANHLYDDVKINYICLTNLHERAATLIVQKIFNEIDALKRMDDNGKWGGLIPWLEALIDLCFDLSLNEELEEDPVLEMADRELSQLLDVVIDEFSYLRYEEKEDIMEQLDALTCKILEMCGLMNFKNCIFLLPDQIFELEVDYLVFDFIYLGLKCEKFSENTLCLREYYRFFWGESKERYLLYKNNIKVKNYQGLIVGMSYVQRGINVERLSKKTMCMAAPSQDFFYDYEMMKHILSQESSSELEFCILDLAPYRLWYDLSLSEAGRNRCLTYYPQVKTMHHFASQEQEIGNYERNATIYKNIIKNDLVDIAFEEMCSQEHLYEEKDMACWNPANADELSIKEEVEKIFNKSYEQTFIENKGILENMLADLTTRNIRPIIVVPPFPYIFRKYMDKNKVAETMQVIEELTQTYPSTIVCDYLSDEDFEDYHFADWSHLNYRGSNLLADKLNQVIDTL
jgi:hypothetical protein